MPTTISGTTTTVSISAPTDSAFIVESGGTLDVVSGGVVSGLINVDDGGILNVNSSGSTLDTVIGTGGVATIFNGGSATETTISSSGELIVNSGGSVSSTTVESTGIGPTDGGLFLFGGTASDTTIDSGGQEAVFAGGVDNNATILAGGAEFVFSGGTASGTTVGDGGQMYVGVYVSSGTEVISSAGGTASNVEVQSGGVLSVFPSGTLDGVTQVQGGGTLEGVPTLAGGGEIILGAGAVTDGSVDMTGTGDSLQIDGTVMPSITISGFGAGDTIDLANVSGGGAGSATMLSGNVLQIAEGGNTYDLNFDPYQDFLGERFVLTSNASGTDVTLSAAPTPAPVLAVTIDGRSDESGGLVTQSTGGSPIASSYNAFYGFGDSNIDTGYFFTHTFFDDSTAQSDYEDAVNDGGGLPTTIGSQMNSALLAQYIGQTAIPVGEPNGTNYAASGATVTGGLSGISAPSIVDQINTYLSSTDGVADPNALYLLSGGGNDLVEALELYPSSDPTDTQDQINYMKSEANAFAAAIEELHNDGAQHIVIDDFNGPGVLAATFNNTLWSDLEATNTPFLVADVDAVVVAIEVDPSAYDAATGADILYTTEPPGGPFSPSNPYNPANGGAVVNADPSIFSNGWSLVGTTADQQPNATTEYLWADNQHLAGAGQIAEANYDENLIDTGVPTVGETLTANPYLATGLGSDTFVPASTLQWQEELSGGTWQNISGATGTTYTIEAANIGEQLRVEAFYDSLSAVSASTEAVISCFMRGTLIRTPRGEVAVELLNRGDIVTTYAGNFMPVRWIGRQTIAAQFADPLRAFPVRIKAGAIGENIPSCDLLLSPDHAILVDGVLIQAGAIVNGMSIVRETIVPDKFTYFHVELDDHSLILAENTPAETFVDNVDRLGFDNWAEYEALYPQGRSVTELTYPRAKAQRQVPLLVRERLARRASLLCPRLDTDVAA